MYPAASKDVAGWYSIAILAILLLLVEFMHSFPCRRQALVAVLSILIIPTAFAAPIQVRDVAGEVMRLFSEYEINETILQAAKSLFWSLATISLVWTMGMLIVRQDIGEMLMELLRFMVVTGIFYWLLINASTHDGGRDS